MERFRRKYDDEIVEMELTPDEDRTNQYIESNPWKVIAPNSAVYRVSYSEKRYEFDPLPDEEPVREQHCPYCGTLTVASETGGSCPNCVYGWGIFDGREYLGRKEKLPSKPNEKSVEQSKVGGAKKAHERIDELERRDKVARKARAATLRLAGATERKIEELESGDPEIGDLRRDMREIEQRLTARMDTFPTNTKAMFEGIWAEAARIEKERTWDVLKEAAASVEQKNDFNGQIDALKADIKKRLDTFAVNFNARLDMFEARQAEMQGQINTIYEGESNAAANRLSIDVAIGRTHKRLDALEAKPDHVGEADDMVQEPDHFADPDNMIPKTPVCPGCGEVMDKMWLRHPLNRILDFAYWRCSCKSSEKIQIKHGATAPPETP